MTFKKKKGKVSYRTRVRKGHYSRRKDNRTSLLTILPAAQRGIIEPILGGNEYGATGALAVAQGGDLIGALREFANIEMINFTGYDMNSGGWSFGSPLKTYTMIIAGWAGSKLASRLGVNSAMRKIPLIGRYVKI